MLQFDSFPWCRSYRCAPLAPFSSAADARACFTQDTGLTLVGLCLKNSYAKCGQAQGSSLISFEDVFH